MDPAPVPLSKSLYKRAQELDLSKLQLQFSGGSDEGFLQVEATSEKVEAYRSYTWEEQQKHEEDNSPEYQAFKALSSEIRDFEEAVDTWAWEVYSYSGAGDGSDYGDNITYDFKENVVKGDSWYTSATYEDPYNTGVAMWQEDPVTRLEEAIKAFESVCSKHKDTGLDDVKTQRIFQGSLVSAFSSGKSPEVEGVEGWALATSDAGIAQELSDHLNTCLKVILDESCGVRRRHLWRDGVSITPPTDNEANREMCKYLKSYCTQIKEAFQNDLFKDTVLG